MNNKTGFFAPGALKLTDALLKLTICHLDDEKNVIDVWPRVVFSLVPALGALLQGFVISFLVLFDEALQADVSADLQPQMAALQKQKEARNTPVSVSEWMYAEKIQIKAQAVEFCVL